MSFMGSPARKLGVLQFQNQKSPLGVIKTKGIQSPEGSGSRKKNIHEEDSSVKVNNAIPRRNSFQITPNRKKNARGGDDSNKLGSPSPSKNFLSPLKKKKSVHQGDGSNKVGSASPSRENCDPNHGGQWFGTTKVFEMLKARRCGTIANGGGLDGGNSSFQSGRKFLVAKRHERAGEQEVEVLCKCFEKLNRIKGGKCLCLASEKLRASQEEFLKENFKFKAGDNPAKELQECDNGEITVADGERLQEWGSSGSEVGCNGEKIEVSEVADSSVNGMKHCSVEGFKGSGLDAAIGGDQCGSEVDGNFEEGQNGDMDEKIQCTEGFKGSRLHKNDALPNGYGNELWSSSQQRVSSPARKPRNELLAEAIGSMPQQGGGRVKHLVKAFETLLTIPQCETTEGCQGGQIYKSSCNVGEGKKDFGSRRFVKWALPGMQQKGSAEKPYSGSSHQTGDNLAKFNYAVSYNNQEKIEFDICKGVQWEHMQSQGLKDTPSSTHRTFCEGHVDIQEVDNGCPSEASYACSRSLDISFEGGHKKQNNWSSHEIRSDSKLPLSEDIVSVGNSDNQSVSSHRRNGSGGGRRRGRKESLDSSGRGSLGTYGMQQWKKQLKVTHAQPFKLQTEQRGHRKEKDFMKKLHDMLIGEQSLRIPKAQGLPYTTDEPECLVKPPVKEATKPLDVKLYTEIRAIDRAEFDQTIAEKLYVLEQQRLEEERLQKLAEEEEIKRLRREMIPRANPMPYFDRPFIPKRSSKGPTVPKEPRFHAPQHKRAKCVSWNDFNVCQE